MIYRFIDLMLEVIDIQVRVGLLPAMLDSRMPATYAGLRALLTASDGRYSFQGFPIEAAHFNRIMQGVSEAINARQGEYLAFANFFFHAYSKGTKCLYSVSFCPFTLHWGLMPCLV